MVKDFVMTRLGLSLIALVLVLLAVFSWWILSRQERGTTGEVSTRFRWVGPNDKIVVDGFDDPKIKGVACHISRAQTGGVKGAIGVAEDTSDAIGSFLHGKFLQLVGDAHVAVAVHGAQITLIAACRSPEKSKIDL